MTPADRARYYELKADAEMHQGLAYEAMANAYAIEGAPFTNEYFKRAANRRKWEIEYRQLAAEARAREAA